MPNGLNLPEDVIKSLEAPLLKIDRLLKDFAESHGATITTNYHGNPGRDVYWVRDGITRGVQITSVDGPRYILGAVAWDDRGGHRRWKGQTLQEDFRVEKNTPNEIRAALDEAVRLADSWTVEDLKPSNRL